jgi:hypothetical protein
MYCDRKEKFISDLKELETVSLTTDIWTSNATNSIKYPRLSVLARQYLSIPGTSVPSERIFSATGLLVNKLRNRISSSVVDHVIFLNKNYIPEQTDTQ